MFHYWNGAFWKLMEESVIEFYSSPNGLAVFEKN